jgi:hypothetical protein
VSKKTAPWALFGEDKQGLGEIVAAVSICKPSVVDGQQRIAASGQEQRQGVASVLGCGVAPRLGHAERSCAGMGQGKRRAGLRYCSRTSWVTEAGHAGGPHGGGRGAAGPQGGKGGGGTRWAGARARAQAAQGGSEVGLGRGMGR